jgi:predicted flap endonuclease-1-like 5' DNA nuclease
MLNENSKSCLLDIHHYTFDIQNIHTMDFQRIKDFFLNDLFAGFADFSTYDNLIFWLFTLSAFLLGYILSTMAAGRIKRKLRKELKETKHELNNTKAELAALQEQHELKTAALQKAELTAEDLANRIEILESEKRQLHTDLYNANEEVEKLNASTQSYASTIDDLNNQIIGLKTKSNEYTGELGASAGGSANVDEEAAAQISEMQDNYNSTLNRLAALEQKLNQLDTENEMLKADLDKMKSSTKLVMSDPAPVSEEIVPVAPRVIKAEEGAAPLKERIVLTPQQERVKALVGTSIPAASDGKKDDLTLINGVGPFLEKKLNNIGIYTYEQISSLNAETIEEVTEAIEFFPGRIEKDDWVGQANRLLGRGGNTTMRARVAAVPVVKEVTDVVITDEALDADAATTEEMELEMLANETTTAIEDATDEIPEEAMEVSDVEVNPEETIVEVEEAAEEIVLGSRSTEEVAEEITEEAAIEETPVDNPFAKYKKNDLKIIEGIGPKISAVLINAGIDTWQKVADMQAEDLKKILLAAGNRFKIHDPSTWPQQAEFAANGNWTKLKEYQDYLVGGKDILK